ncbi:hypothetical protein GCM10023322_54870 [Rugosimonospora acidiphila]|uniref:Uncharacterized protein n=1 Tax=Rugosimonospora acidiphila TaxID=556531 RepID=A0ABP9SBM5_9ACTN
MPVAGVDPLPDEVGWAACLAHRAPGLDVITGTTARKMGAFYALNPVLQRTRLICAVGDALADSVERAAGTAGFCRPARHLAIRAAVRMLRRQFLWCCLQSLFLN